MLRLLSPGEHSAASSRLAARHIQSLPRLSPTRPHTNGPGRSWLAFSSETRDYAGRIDTRIILIDGTDLARLMITYGVGVAPVAVCELKRVDSDFFAEQ